MISAFSMERFPPKTDPPVEEAFSWWTIVPRISSASNPSLSYMGMLKALKRAKRIILMSEFSHYDIKEAGDSPTRYLDTLKKMGFKIVEIPVTHLPRLQGKGTGRNFKVILQSFIDLFKLWRKLI